jgi:hypothetical protein
MKAQAIKEAQEHLERAAEAVESMQNGKGRRVFERAWFDFLVHYDAVYEKLKTGSRYTDNDRKWYRGVERFRDKDHLLSYLHHARDARSHGLSTGWQLKAPVLKALNDPNYTVPIGRRGKEIVLRRAVKGGGHIAVLATLPKGVQLTTVIDDRYKTEFPVPRFFLGKRIPSMKIHDLLAQVIVFLDMLIVDANKVPKN